MEHVTIIKIDAVYNRYTADKGYALKMIDDNVLRPQIEIKAADENKIEVVKV